MLNVADADTTEVVERVHGAMARAWNGAIPLIPAFSTPPLTDLFRQMSPLRSLVGGEPSPSYLIA
jgi:hypothetical protein